MRHPSKNYPDVKISARNWKLSCTMSLLCFIYLPNDGLISVSSNYGNQRTKANGLQIENEKTMKRNNNEFGGFHQYFTVGVDVKVDEKWYFDRISLYWNFSIKFRSKFHKLYRYNKLRVILAATETEFSSSIAGLEFEDV